MQMVKRHHKKSDVQRVQLLNLQGVQDALEAAVESVSSTEVDLDLEVEGEDSTEDIL